MEAELSGNHTLVLKDEKSTVHIQVDVDAVNVRIFERPNANLSATADSVIRLMRDGSTRGD